MNAYYLAMGHFLGYPKCCREEFASGKTAKKFGRTGQFPLVGTGFVPCLKCAETKDAGTLLREIVANRLYTVPFPASAGFSIHEEYRTAFNAFCEANGYEEVVDMFN